MRKITIIDCGIGNRAAIRNMLKLIGENPSITSESNEIKMADIIILPGIGSYDSFMLSLQKLKLCDTINEHALVKKKPILGICIGMQALFDCSEEGQQSGLGLINGSVEYIGKCFSRKNNVKIPHIGWKNLNYIQTNNACKNEKFYFAHSYHCIPKHKNEIHSLFEYEGKSFISSIKKDNIWGVQFHPEKSHKHGINFFREFLSHV